MQLGLRTMITGNEQSFLTNLSRGLLFLSIFLLVSARVCAGTATVQLKGTLDEVIKILVDPTLSAPEKVNERNEMLRKIVEERIDRTEIARRALGDYWKETSEKEKEEFVEAFNSLLQHTYLDRIDTYLKKANGFSSENIAYINEKEKEGRAVIETKVKIDAQTEFPVNYLLQARDGNWLISDIAIEGVSIVRNYRVQFKEILARSSFTDLLTQLKAKESQFK